MGKLRKDAIEEYDIYGNTLRSLDYANQNTKDEIIDIYRERVIRYFPEFADDIELVDPEYDIPSFKHEKGSCLIKLRSSGDVFIFQSGDSWGNITQLSHI